MHRLLVILFLISGLAAAQPSVRSNLRSRAAQMRQDWHHYWDGLDLPLEHAQDRAARAGDAAGLADIKRQRAALKAQYEQLVEQRINDGHAYLAKHGINRRYQRRKSQAVAEDAADFAKFLESVAAEEK